MPKALLVISKKITVFMMVILFAVSMALFISPGKIYGTVPVTSITVTSADGAITVANGGTLQMSAVAFPEGSAQGVSWSVSPGESGTAKIDSSGVLTGTGMGLVYVFARSTTVPSVSGHKIITVTEPLAPPAEAPTASAVNITGTAQAGRILTGSYTYSDINGDPEGESTFKWLSSDAADGTYTEISGAESKTFMLTSYQAGKFIRFEVTPEASAGTLLTGTAVQSSATSVVLAAEEEAAVPDNNPGIPGSSGNQASGPAVWADLPPSSSAVYEKTIPGFVTLFYNTILGRAPDEEGLRGWAAGLASGALTGADLVRGFIFSVENKVLTAGDTDEQFITSLYRLIFNRVPDAEGLKSWLANLNAGMTKEEVINYFTSSEEFISLCKEYGVRP